MLDIISNSIIVRSRTVAVIALAPVFILAVITNGWHILPNQHSEAVAIVVPARRLHLYMLSYHIEAQFFGFLYIEGHSLGSRSGI